MRSSLRVLAVLGLAAFAACTTKNAEAPPLSGPSGLATTILMTADKDILSQNGLDEAVITVTAIGPNGEPKNVNLRAQILVAGVPQDYGTLSTKTLTTPTVIRYRAPAASDIAAAQSAQSVQISVTPIGDDFNGQVSRTIEIRLVPPGIILPSNPSLVPAFTVTPAAPQAFNPVSFDASTTTNGGVACRDACSYSWNFGDGTTGSGQSTTHTFRTVGTFQVALTVTDSRGAQTTSIQSVTVAPSTPPTAGFQVSPATVGVNQDAFFNASESRPAAGRTITRYDWNFGDGQTASGATVSHRFSSPGSYSVVLIVTDDAGAQTTVTKSYPVTSAGGLTAGLTFLPSDPKPGQPVAFNASTSKSDSSTIVNYKFTYGDGGPGGTPGAGGSEDSGPSPTQTHVSTAPGTFVATLVVTDAQGRTGTTQVSVTVK